MEQHTIVVDRFGCNKMSNIGGAPITPANTKYDTLFILSRTFVKNTAYVMISTIFENSDGCIVPNPGRLIQRFAPFNSIGEKYRTYKSTKIFPIYQEV